MTSNIQEAGRAAPAASTKKAGRPLCAGIATALLLSCAPAALHAETSNAELAKEIAELKAQIHELRGAVSSTRSEVRKVKVVAAPAPYAPAFVPPPGATPVFVTADKKMQFGALTITPGGFVEGASIFRSRATQSDLQSNFNGSPFDNTVAGHPQEFKFSARQTRAALLIEGAITPTMLVSGYGELDFLGAASSANYNQTDGFQPRIRNLYATLDANDYGMHVLAGQSWSLLTLNSKGITPRNEVTPAVIDASQVVGSLYARQPGIRLVKDFNKKLWLGVSLEESQTTGCPSPTNVLGTAAAGTATTVTNGTNGVQNLANGITAVCDTTGTGGSFTSAANGGTNFSFNHLPDVIGKAVYEARFGDRDVHFEAEGVFTNLYDRVIPTTETLANQNTASNRNTYGYGVGGGIIVPVIPKRLDFQANGLYGRGINRYGAGQLTEATFNPDGSLRPDRGYVTLAGLTFHATPSFDIYGYAGVEGVARAYTNGISAAGAATTVGIGAPSTNDTGCYLEGSTACNGSTRRLFELTGGFWDKIYKGGFGEVRVGANYAYINRQIYNNNQTAATTFQPKTSESIVETSLRYYPFQ